MISLVCITYNEADKIAFWYKQHKKLADEFVVVDTGSTDNTVEVASKLKGVKVYCEPWKHDFADAKNKALKYCTEDWVFFLSPDFYVDEENFDIIKSATKSKKYVAFAMPMVHEFNTWVYKRKKIRQKINNFEKDNHILFFRNNPLIEFRHRVHEQVKDSIIDRFGKDKIGFLPVIRHHDSTHNFGRGAKKQRYYNYLEDMAAIDRKILEIGEDLRKEAYAEEEI